MHSSLCMVAALTALTTASPLSDAQQRQFYGYAFQEGPTRELLVPVDADQTLREAAVPTGIWVGSETNYGELTGSDKNYSRVALSEYALTTAENECKYDITEPQQGTFVFEECDAILTTFAATNGTFRLHNECWGGQNPPWLSNGKFTPDELRAILTNHITKVMQHYNSTGLNYYAVDVVNEAVSDSGTAVLKNVVPWYPAVPDYLNVAFTAARAADPSKKLCYNDYGAEGAGSAKANKVLALVKQLQADKVPIDCVGLQMHISVDSYPSGASISQNIADLGALGLEVHITEMDVKVSNASPARLQLQAQVYGDVLSACLNNTNCKVFETWGFTDKYTWVGTANQPLPFDTEYNKKPSYYELLATLQAHAKRITLPNGDVHMGMHVRG